ncbi:MAG: hypothetical protein AMJ55_07700 [Gammaproteobacteria bacterium SG8_15]|nr:MAG: hypothetical protein AMJ55_07700 [Gammaproteobacteria bacterium SG8_15]
MRSMFIYGIAYFALVFGIGFLLGTLRVLVLVPAFGERYAELSELPLMLIAIYFSARLLLRKLPITPNIRYLYAGVLALLLLLVFEFTVVLNLRDMSLQQYFSSRDPVSGAAYVFSLLIYMLMPYILATRAK